MALAISNIDFNRLSSKQKLDIFVWKVKTTFEDIRNNALLWKAVWNNLEVPSKWKIHFSTNNSWTILSEAFDKNGSIISSTNLFFQKDIEINKIKCWELFEDETSYWTLANTWTIEFNWINISLDVNWDTTNCNQSKDKIHETIYHKSQSRRTLYVRYRYHSSKNRHISQIHQ